MFFVIFFLKNISIVHFFLSGKKEYKLLQNEGTR